jgi:ubiquinone/menaquinone biosynthesis C-methylase UbiE
MEKSSWDKISKSYYEEILSPIKNSEDKFLFEDLNKIENKENKKVINLGCGIGDIEKFLSNNFKSVLSVDFSEGMIEKAKEKNKDLKNVSFLISDIEKLPAFHNQFDIAIAVNSIISEDFVKIDNIFKEVNNLLIKDGQFICILPAMDVFLYQSLLIADKGFKNYQSKEEVIKNTLQIMSKKEYNFLLGVTDFEGEQKYYYSFEILWRLKKAGFKDIEIKKLSYSWEEFKKAGQAFFPDEDPPWDWYVVCKK